jgi:hypothetical protein
VLRAKSDWATERGGDKEKRRKREKEKRSR